MGRWNVNISPFDISLENLMLRKLSNRAMSRLCLFTLTFFCLPAVIHALFTLWASPQAHPYSSLAAWTGEVSHVSLLPALPPFKVWDCSGIMFKLSALQTCSPLSIFLLPPRQPKKALRTCDLQTQSHPTPQPIPLKASRLRTAIWGGLLSLPQYGGNLKTDSPKASPPQTFHQWLGPWNRASAVAYGFFFSSSFAKMGTITWFAACFLENIHPPPCLKGTKKRVGFPGHQKCVRHHAGQSVSGLSYHALLLLPLHKWGNWGLEEWYYFIRGHRNGVLEPPVWKEAFLIYSDITPKPPPRWN